MNHLNVQECLMKISGKFCLEFICALSVAVRTGLRKYKLCVLVDDAVLTDGWIIDWSKIDKHLRSVHLNSRIML